VKDGEIKTKQNRSKSSSNKIAGGSITTMHDKRQDIVEKNLKKDDTKLKKVPETNAPNKKNLLLISVAEKSKGTYLSLEEGRKYSNLLSPFALPENVICIDDHNDSTLCYNHEYITYLRELELKQKIKPTPSAFPTYLHLDKRRSTARVQLSDWLLEVCHYFKTSQECLYQTINLLDVILSGSCGMKFPSKDVQLVGISCLLIATKIEEYYPADLKELARLTENSWKPQEIVQMELQILKAVSFMPQSVDPMQFLHRCISAARRSLFLSAKTSPIEEDIFYELCLFNIDCLVMNYSYWELLPSKKASAAVYAALMLFTHAFRDINPFSNCNNDDVFQYIATSDDDANRGMAIDCNGNYLKKNNIWNPTLVHYSGYSETSIKKLSSIILELLLKVRVFVEKDKSKHGKSLENALAKKFSSVSRHHALLKRQELSSDNIKLSIDSMKR